MNRRELICYLTEKGMLGETESYLLLSVNDIEDMPLLPRNLTLITLDGEEGKRNILRQRLQEKYDEASRVTIVCNSGKIFSKPIKYFNSKIGHDEKIVIIDPKKCKTKGDNFFQIHSLADVVKTLREPGGCPWDRKQTHDSLRTYFLQEVYEVIDAIDKNDMVNLKEELGDVLLQIVFHARLAEENGYFSVQDVIDAEREKMIKRHPWVFAKTDLDGEAESFLNWEKRKKSAKKRKNLLEGIPKSLPSLLLTCIIQKKVSSVGVHSPLGCEKALWDSWMNTLEKVKTGESGDESVGALLFTLVRVLQEQGVDPELSLHRYCIEFMALFTQFEDSLAAGHLSIDTMEEKEVEMAWHEFLRHRSN